MGRIRTLKPDFFRSKKLARCSLAARLTYQGLWCEADDHGRGEAEPRVLAGAIWPLDDEIGWEQVLDHHAELEEVGCIRIYDNARPLSGRPLRREHLRTACRVSVQRYI